MARLLALLLCLLLAAPALAEPVDINRAGQAELETLPQIGPSKAAAIIAYREEHGLFTSPGQLDLVPGIGPATLSVLLPLVTCGGAGQAAMDEDGSPAPSPAPAPAPASSSRSSDRSKSGSGEFGLDIDTPAEGEPEAAAAPATPARSAASTGGLIDINSATLADLDRLPGIGASKAAAILADREQNGPFKSCADLDRVQGIGPTTVANLEGSCTAK